MSRHTKHLGQTSLGSKGDARSHRHTHIGSIAVPGPLKWPAINAKTMLFVQDRCAKCQHASDVNYDACIRMRSDNGSLLFISEKTDGVPLSTSNNLFFSVHFTAARIPTAIFLQLPLQTFVFCHSSCGSSVTATWSLFIVLFCVILRARNFRTCSFVPPSH